LQEKREMTYQILHGNNLDILPTLADNSIDSIVTDPPYELGFMSKKWDSSGIAYSVELWQQCLRVLKPGGHLLSFGGTRTYHRVAVAIEDAGFELRDSIAWLYGSGFPKSLDVSKAIDKKPEALQTTQFKVWLSKQIELCNKTRKQIDDECGFTACSYSKTDGKDYWSTNHPTKEKWSVMKQVIGLSDDWDWIITDNIEERGFIESTGGLHGGSGNTVGNFTGKQLSNVAVSKEAQQWQGWGTALKPAFEPVIVARKPIEGTVANNVLKWGTGGLNIDGSRIGTEIMGGGTMPNLRDVGTMSKEATGIDKLSFGQNPRPATRLEQAQYTGRWPANIILDPYTAELLDEQSGTTKDGTHIGRNRVGDKPNGVYGTYKAEAKDFGYGGSGGASRFFYVAKASKRDRNEGLEELLDTAAADMVEREPDSAGMNSPRAGAGRTSGAKNFHPTVKPTSLMEYLIKLVTPPQGTVLDPFTGSGSTGKAAILQGFDFIGIEMTEEYLPIIEGRLKHAEAKVAERIKETVDQEQEKLF
jgi:DNA modification methylase